MKDYEPPGQFEIADEHPEKHWDEETAFIIIGTVVLIGVTNVDAKGAETDEQMYGTVVHADPNRGIDVELAGSRDGEMFTLPPSTAAFHEASPGHYRLRQSEEVVVDPDYTVVFTVHARREHS